MLLIDTVRRTFPDFKGIFNKGDDDAVPFDHLVDALNVELTPGKIFSRRGTSIRKAFTSGGARTSFYQFHAAGSAPIIFSSDIGNIYKNDTKVLGPLANWYSISASQMFNKLFISPRTKMFSRYTGINYLYIYDAANDIFRLAGGIRPTIDIADPIMVAVDGAAGVVPLGTRNIAVVYETETGFLTPPGPLVDYPSPARDVFTPTTYTGPGGLKIDLSIIPCGPASDRIIARHIIITRADETEYFFVPGENGGIIHDNTTTITTLDFLDTDLVESAGYLFDVLERIPAGVGLMEYSGRMVVYGFSSADSSLVRLSLPGEPETFDATDGFVIVSKDDGYGINAGFKLRDALYIGKEKGIYATADNGDEPSSWEVSTIDEAIGIVVDGVSQVSPSKPQGSHNDACLLTHASGVYLFDGVVRHPEFTWKVSKIWDAEFADLNVSIVFDVHRKLVFITGIGTEILVGSYINGIDPEKVRWLKWTLPESPLFAGLIDPDAGGNPEYIVSTATTRQLIKFDAAVHRDFGSKAINSYGQTAYVTFEDGMVCFLSGLHYKVEGARNFFTTIIGCDDSGNDPSKNAILAPIQLIEKPGITYKRYSQYQNEKVSVKFESTELDAWFSLSKLIAYGRPIFYDRPQ